LAVLTTNGKMHWFLTVHVHASSAINARQGAKNSPVPSCVNQSDAAMKCPNCDQPMTIVGRYWMCGRHDPPLCLPIVSVAGQATSPDFAAVDLTLLPYPVALTADRLRHAIDSSADILKTLFVLKDCFEATIKYLGVVLLTDYFHSPGCTPERNEILLEKMVRPSLGVWVQTIVGDVSRWLAGAGHENLPVVTLFVHREGHPAARWCSLPSFRRA
jgi:hypothetical protein